MDLKQFVSETLTQIVAGVEDARTKIAAISPNAKVNPDWFREGETRSTYTTPSPVEFDVALVVTSESATSTSDKAGGSAGILSVVTAKLSAEIQSQESGNQKNETVSRVKFSVLLSQPADIEIYPKQNIPRQSTNWMA